tara:strand:+ start:2762 stop:3226 length:465 start_codon:yes stop_codon:yes gene_type:complete
MKLVVLRYSSQKDSTNGLLFEQTDSGLDFLCYTLEDEEREVKVMGETCIPNGTYKIGLRTEGGFHTRYFKRFPDIHQGMLEVQDVPNFKYVLIHCGNTDEHTAGCLLIGDSQENNALIENGFIGKSSQAYARIYLRIIQKVLEGEEVLIEYKKL